MVEVKDVHESYPLSRDYLDFDRINIQHYIWKDIFDYNIYPRSYRADVPDDLIERLDLVNLRLFAFVIQDDPTPVLQPGGHLQWSEVDPTDNLGALWEETVPQGTRLLPSWSKTLAMTSEREGLLNVEMIADRVRRANAEKATEIDRLVLGAAAESFMGAIFGCKKVTVIGQKHAK
ncbi:hypothetical protein F5Y10DRAFT_283389 [Nemania abortiva]|nr:hypothetical protein F5Y10DRAFT_283389 [Nemania abortiva]